MATRNCSFDDVNSPKGKMLGKRSWNKFQGISRLVPKTYELNIRQNIFSDFSSPRLGLRLMHGAAYTRVFTVCIIDGLVPFSKKCISY